MKISYDYTYEINRLKGEIELHSLTMDHEVAIERGEPINGYRPIKAWYFSGYFAPDVEILPVDLLLKELEELNSLN